MNYLRKIVGVDHLVRIVSDLRRSDGGSRGTLGADGESQSVKTVVQCHGCFDIVHPGHIRYLEFARTQGDILIVSITGDAAIDKGDQRPYIPEELRAENLAALEFVDYVVIDSNATASEILKIVRPDVYVKGQEYATSDDPRFLDEKAQVESYGGRVIMSSGQVVFSSSKLVDALPQADTLSTQRLVPVCKRHSIDQNSLAGILSAIQGKRVLILGDLVVERYVLCDAKDIASESPMMSLSELDKRDYLGGAATLATQVAAMGGKPDLITGLGEGPSSEWAVQTLRDSGVGVQALRHLGELPLKTRFLVDDQKLFKVNRTTLSPLDSIGERDVLSWLSRRIHEVDVIIVFDSGYGMITPSLLQQMNDILRKGGPLVVGGQVDSQCDISELRCFDLLCLSERDLRSATADFGGGLSSLAYRMLESTQAKRMLVTLGKRGVVTFDRRSHDPHSSAWNDRLMSEHLPSFASRVVDRLGCGETMLALSALALAGEAGLMQAAYLGSLAAALQIAAPGLVSVSMDSLRAWSEHRPEICGTRGIGATHPRGSRRPVGTGL